jgi:hypothetical protein
VCRTDFIFAPQYSMRFSITSAAAATLAWLPSSLSGVAPGSALEGTLIS